MSGIFAHAWLLVACLYIVRSAAGPTDVSRNQSINDRRTKSYFIEAKQRMNFYESLEYCKNKGMGLATFDDEEEFKQLVETIGKAYLSGWQMFWVAGSDLAERDVWRWHTTGREMAYLPWHMGQPDHRRVGGEEQHCVGVWRNFDGYADISDMYCSATLRPICEY